MWKFLLVGLIAPLATPAGMLGILASVCAADTAAAATVYNESVDGDLSSDQSPGNATDLGLLGVGTHTLFINDAGGAFDPDYFTFEVAAGSELTVFLLADYTDSDFSFASISLESGQDPFLGSTVEFINWNGSPSLLDLLLFDSAPGSQPGGDFVVSVLYSDAASVDYSMSITAVVAPAPEPGTGLLGAASLLALAAIRKRGSK